MKGAVQALIGGGYCRAIIRPDPNTPLEVFECTKVVALRGLFRADHGF
jgi:hypothetical protein